MFSIVAFALASTLAVSAANVTIAVGANNQLDFQPSSVMAQIGDTLVFEFQSKNHSVTQSTFASPCSLAPNGIDSGFMFVAAGATTFPTWSFQVTNSTPLWFYCAQTQPMPHCAAGMVFAVNPTADKTFNAFQATAESGNAAASGGASVSGGIIPAPSTLPGAGSPSGASGVGAASGFSTVVSSTASSTDGAAASASSTTSPNGAVGLSSAGTMTLVSLFAAAAGFML